MREEVVCYQCGREMRPFLDWRCSECGGPLVIKHDAEFSPSLIKKEVKSMWRYREFLPPSMRRKITSLGEGYTPLNPALTPNISLKLEYINPTGSFKDRGTAAMLTSLRNTIENVNGVCEDSSGNAGASIAGYCAAVGIPCVVYGGESMVYEKAFQIRMYGAELVMVRGTREQVAEEAVKIAARRGMVYVGHSWNPYFIEGMKTVAYEIAEQTSWNLSDEIYLPVSAGTLLLGLAEGLKDMFDTGFIEKIPKIVAVQPELNAPIYAAFHNTEIPKARDEKSVADALTLKNPPRLRQIVDTLRSCKGDVEMVSEEEIIRAYKQLGWSGVFAEPSSAVAYAAVRRKLDDLASSGKNVLVIITGSGHKSIEAFKLVQ